MVANLRTSLPKGAVYAIPPTAFSFFGGGSADLCREQDCGEAAKVVERPRAKL